MSGEAVRKAWLVAASIGAVEALKDQGVARWNAPLMKLHQHAKTKLLSSYRKTTADSSGRSLFTGAKSSSCSLAAGTAGEYRVKKRNEESINKIMAVSCFGPNTVRF